MRTLVRTVLLAGALAAVGALPACSQAGGVAAQQSLAASSGSSATGSPDGAAESPSSSSPAPSRTSSPAGSRSPRHKTTSPTTAAARSQAATRTTRSPTAQARQTPSPSARGGATHTPAPSASPLITTQVPGGDAEEADVLRLTNVERLKAGCQALTWNAVLGQVAQAHSKDMAVANYFDHDSPDGRSPFDRMTAAGYRYSTAAENIAAGQPTAAAVVDAWMNSAGHRANILNCSLRELGVGVYRRQSSTYRVYWTQDFATRR